MKLAPNPNEQQAIRQMVLEGRSPEEISGKLRIKLKSVADWCEHFEKAEKEAEKEAAAAAKAAEEAAAAKAAEEREALKNELRAEIEAELKASKPNKPPVNK